MTTTVIVLALAYAAFALAMAVAARAPREYFVIVSGVVGLVVLVQALIATVQLIGGDRPDELGTFVLYLIVSVIIMPAGTLWALAERSRWGPAVLGVACLALVVVVVRLSDLWSTVSG